MSSDFTIFGGKHISKDQWESAIRSAGIEFEFSPKHTIPIEGYLFCKFRWHNQGDNLFRLVKIRMFFYTPAIDAPLDHLEARLKHLQELKNLDSYIMPHEYESIAWISGGKEEARAVGNSSTFPEV